MERSFNVVAMNRGFLLKWTRDILRRYGVRPRRRLSQNFVVDPVLINEIVSYIDRDIDVTEVGCGIGTLTHAILTKARRVVCVEIDPKMCEIAREVVNRVEFITINADSLKTPFNTKIIVSNTPYHITSDLITKISRENIVEKAVLTLQEEVVDRLVAKPGSRSYGRLTVLVSLLFNIQTGRSYSPHSFYPTPDVNSQVVVFTRKRTFDIEINAVEKTTRILFTHKRKVIDKILYNLLEGDRDLPSYLKNKVLGRRIYTIEPETWLEIARFLSERGFVK
ncbi:MAG: 16S rRNA (adenine(1518)-N(6)/adenine(1519)-N(6))-dimethyltransferase RsmA [Desulfurococcaceae archaeon]